MKRSIIATLAVFILGCIRAEAVPINLGDIQSPEIETFDGVLGFGVSPVISEEFGDMWGTASAGLVLPSGLKFILPDPNSFADFIIGDFLFDSGSYGLSTNGRVASAADLRGGTSLGGAGGTEEKLFEFTFRFPTPVRRFGVFASAARGRVYDGTLSLTSMVAGGAAIESVSFPTNPIPFNDDNFVGLSAAIPIGAFTISSNNFFVFDDVIWEPVPEPTGLAIAVVGGLGLLVLLWSRKRLNVSYRPRQLGVRC